MNRSYLDHAILISHFEQEIFFHRKDVQENAELTPGQVVLCEFAFDDRHGLQAKNIRIQGDRQNLPPNMSEKECEDHIARRRHEESVQSLFQTGFWKYPTSVETQPIDAGGHGLNFHPFVKDEKFFRHGSSDQSDSPGVHVSNGPDLGVKTARKPWLKDGKIMPYLIKSPSRYPLQARSSFFVSRDLVI